MVNPDATNDQTQNNVPYPPQQPMQFMPQSNSIYPPPQAVHFPPLGVPANPNQFQNQTTITATGGGAWSSDLLDCMNDPTNAVITAIFPCVTFGQIAEILDEGRSPCMTSGLVYAPLLCLLSRGYRTRLRNKYGLVESPAPDWAVHTMFEWCALCQEYRELSLRGLDPSIGWQANLARMQLQQQQQQLGMMPPMNQTMMG